MVMNKETRKNLFFGALLFGIMGSAALGAALARDGMHVAGVVGAALLWCSFCIVWLAVKGD